MTKIKKIRTQGSLSLSINPSDFNKFLAIIEKFYLEKESLLEAKFAVGTNHSEIGIFCEESEHFIFHQVLEVSVQLPTYLRDALISKLTDDGFEVFDIRDGYLHSEVKAE